jgi:hypothetical protein
MGDNFKAQSLAQKTLVGLPNSIESGGHTAPFIVARVRPRTSKGITDLLLPFLMQLEAALSL